MASGRSNVNLDCTQSLVFNAASNGKLDQLKVILDHRPKKDIETFISTFTNGRTPLLAASQEDHVDVVTYLIEKCHADVEQVGCVRIDGDIMEGAPPLWCAAAFNQLNIVKVLIKHNANVNATTKTSSTPLRAACFGGHFEIVKYLVENGADVEISNRYGHTSLMIACYKRHYEIAKYLIDSGADLNRKSNKGSTALHDCAESGSLEILKFMLKAGAKIDKNESYISPLLAAADCGNVSIVEYLLQKISCTKREKIDAFELLGSFFIDKRPNMPEALRFWTQALAMKSEEKDFFLEDSYKKSWLASYLDISEVHMAEKAAGLFANPERMILQALLIRERVLGPHHPETIYYIRFIGAKYGDEDDFQRCIQLWKYALDLQQEHEKPLSKATHNNLIAFTELLTYMIIGAPDRSPRAVDEILYVFKKTVLEIENSFHLSKTQEPIPPEDFHAPVIVAMRLIALMCRLLPSLSESEEFSFKMEVNHFVQLNPKAYKFYTPLHLACFKDPEYDQNPSATYQTKEVVELLLEVGASPNAVDHEGNSPLHLAAKSEPFHIGIFQTLLNHGAHLDARNCKNETPLSLAHPSNISGINPLQYMSLQCLCAKTIHFFQIPYEEFVSGDLLKLLNLHK